jgi:hypoxanthine phosphoribosyltransferase
MGSSGWQAITKRTAAATLAALRPAHGQSAADGHCFTSPSLSRWNRIMSAVKKTAVHPDLAEVLFTDDQIKDRVRTLAGEIRAAYGTGEFTIISLINGAVMFTADLMREIDNPVRLDCIRVSSYGAKTKSIGTPQVIYSLTLDIKGRHVLLIDDILDTGKTLSLVCKLIRDLKPASLRTCVLLDKKERREVSIEADFVGFSIPNKFVVGYGLDFAERYRNLPCVGVLKPELQNTAAWTAG